MKLQDREESGSVTTVTDWLARFHIDAPLLTALLMLCTLGLFILYSASDRNLDLVVAQFNRICIGLVAMVVVAQVPPEWFKTLAPWAYCGGIVLLVLVLVLGDVAQGAQRWIDLGFISFQPSEIMKVAMPLMLAGFLHYRAMPPTWRELAVVLALLAVPLGLIVEQPDLGTALLVGSAGAFVIYFAGLRWRLIFGIIVTLVACAPLLWLNLHGYQRERVLTFLNPSRDPLGAGYHITQSKIAIGSGGLFGKGWLNGTQARLDFLPESTTDFIFAVYAEEAGLLGAIFLLLLYSFVVLRGLWISARGQDSFQRLLGASLSLTFSVYVIVNIGMVIGVLPVVGVPLPLISYGGTSMVTLLATTGILMSIQTHRKLLSS